MNLAGLPFEKTQKMTDRNPIDFATQNLVDGKSLASVVHGHHDLIDTQLIRQIGQVAGHLQHAASRHSQRFVLVDLNITGDQETHGSLLLQRFDLGRMFTHAQHQHPLLELIVPGDLEEDEAQRQHAQKGNPNREAKLATAEGKIGNQVEQQGHRE